MNFKTASDIIQEVLKNTPDDVGLKVLASAISYQMVKTQTFDMEVNLGDSGCTLGCTLTRDE